jgi:threonine dehydrogenase-like Zn-dependent dehydrogenase
MVHKIERALRLETDTPEIINEMVMAVKKMGRVGIISDYVGFANHVNIGAIMEKGVRVIGNGQAPIQKYWEHILKDYIVPGKFDPTL